MKILFILLFSAACFAQTASVPPAWFKVANEGSTVTSVAPITYRYGSGSSWTAARTSSSVAVNNTTFGDPLPYAVKELDVLETSVPQAVLVDGVSVTVPALALTGNVTAAPVATVTTKDQMVTTTSPVIPAGTTICTVPKTGGACKNSLPITLGPLTAKVPGQNTPVVFVPMTFSCPNVPMVNGVPDLTQPLLDCKVAAK